MCSHQLDVQEVNISVLQFNRIKDEFTGWTESLLLICGRWWSKCSVHRTAPKHQPIQQQETVRGMRTTSHQTQILLTASLSCTYLETMKQWSIWSWTMTHVSRTHRVALDCFLTESTWTQRSKSQLADYVIEGSLVIIKWIFLCFLAAFFVQLKRRLPCRREFNKEERTRACGSTAKSQCVWFQQAWTKDSRLPSVWMLPKSQRMRRWFQGLLKEPRELAVRTVSKADSKNPETNSQVWKGDNQSQRSCGKVQQCADDHVTHDGRSCGLLQQDNAQGPVLDSS